MKTEKTNNSWTFNINNRVEENKNEYTKKVSVNGQNYQIIFQQHPYQIKSDINSLKGEAKKYEDLVKGFSPKTAGIIMVSLQVTLTASIVLGAFFCPPVAIAAAVLLCASGFASFCISKSYTKETFLTISDGEIMSSGLSLCAFDNLVSGIELLLLKPNLESTLEKKSEKLKNSSIWWTDNRDKVNKWIDSVERSIKSRLEETKKVPEGVYTDEVKSLIEERDNLNKEQESLEILKETLKDIYTFIESIEEKEPLFQ